MQREERYTVLKNSDVREALDADETETLINLCDKVAAWRSTRGKAAMQCVVVEHDWPEYEPTWAAIASRVDAGAAEPTFTAAEIAELSAKRAWPKERFVGRTGDMAPPGETVMRVGLDNDNDVVVTVFGCDHGRASMASIEFCVPGSGGGKSSHTREALIALMVAMEKDDAESPRGSWPPPGKVRA